MIRIVRHGLFLLSTALIFSGIAACQDTSKVASSTKVAQAIGTDVSLTLTGYNYTNRYIDQFSVGSAAGGNLFLSSPGGGGGGSVCCIPYVIGASAWKTIVRWQVDACTYNNSVDESGKPSYEIHSFFKEIEVQIDPHIPENPQYFEVHFFSDGHVEAAITAHSSPPRVILSKDREDKTPFKKCPNDKQPI